MSAEKRIASYSRPPGDFLDDSQRVSLCELLDRVLNQGTVVVGHLTISVADVDLLYLGLEVVLASTQTIQGSFEPAVAKVRPC
jgi:hypothetical protein